MIVKFKTGAAAYGLGYTEGELADITEVKTRVLTTLLDKNGNAIGMDWRDQVFTADELISKGIAVQAPNDEASAYKAKLAAEAKK